MSGGKWTTTDERPRGSFLGRLLPRLSPEMMVAITALVMALGGSSYAAFRLGAGSVGSRELKNRAVTGSKLAPGAVTSAKLAPGAVTSGKLAPGAVTSGNLAAGAVTGSALGNGAVTGPKLAPGAVGSQQAQPGAGVSVTYETSPAFNVGASATSSIFQKCPAETNAIGGGVLPDDPRVVVLGTGPYDTPAAHFGGPADAWAGYVSNNDSGAAHTFVVFAVCVTAGAVH